MRKVRIKGLPNKAQGGTAGRTKSGANEGLRRFLDGNKNYDSGMNQFAEPEFRVNKSINAVDRSEANIEAEGGEQAIVPGQGGIPESYKINGPRHHSGGVPLNLAEDSFIFSDTKDMKIKDREVLAEFGMSVPKKGKVKGYTPAQIAKKYDLNEAKKTLLNPDSDMLERETAEQMIKNYNMKLGKLALVQESMKGFPERVPQIALPYLESIQQDPTQFSGEGEQPQMAAYGAGVTGDPSQYAYMYGGENVKMAKRFPGLDVKQRGGEFTGAFWDSVLQEGGQIPIEDYATAEDATRMEFIEPEVWNQKYGTPEQIRQAKFDAIVDPEAAGLEEQYYNPMREMTSEELDVINGRINPDTKQVWGGVDGAFDEDAVNTEKQQYIQNKLIEKNTGVSSKPTKKYNIPKDAVILNEDEAYDPANDKVGDYIRRKDGKLYKVIETGASKLSRTSTSGKEGYVPTYGSLEDDIKEANRIVDKYIKQGDAFTRKDGKININREAKDELTLDEKDFLTKLSSYKTEDGKLGAPGFEIGTQSSKGDPFYGFVDPELIEYRYWKAKNPGGNSTEYSKLGPEEQIANRKEFLNTVGDYSPEEINKLEQEGRLINPGELYTVDFMKGTKDSPGFTERNQKFFKGESFRPGHGDDFKFGLEHVDDYSFVKERGYEEIPEIETPTGPVAGRDPEYIESATDAPWWAQDVGNMALTVAERARLRKYMPNSVPIDLARPDVVYYDPSRALAANAEQANIAAQQIGAFAGSQGTHQLSNIQGQAFANAANTLADYEAKNVGVANQYLDKVNATANREHLANAERLQKLYDETTVANQQYDNSVTAANRNIFDAWRQGLTNATKTQTLNTLYPQYNVDPWSGGKTHFTEGRDFVKQTPTGSSSSDYVKGYQSFLKESGLEDNTKNYDMYRDSQGLPNTRRRGRRGQAREDYWNRYNS